VKLVDVGTLIADLERVLDLRFERHVDVFSDVIMSSEEMVKQHGQAIQQWLSPFAATLGTNMKAPDNEQEDFAI